MKTRTKLLIGLVISLILLLSSKLNSLTLSPLLLALKPSEWHWPDQTYQCIEYVVGRGDNLWTIAQRYYPNRDPRIVVWAIRRVNKLEGPDGPVIVPGQCLWIPDPMLYGVGTTKKGGESK